MRGEHKGLYYTDGVPASGAVMTTVSHDLVRLSFGSLGISELPKEETGRNTEDTAAEWFSTSTLPRFKS